MDTDLQTRSKTTQRIYDSAWNAFSEWAANNRVNVPCSYDDIARYLHHLLRRRSVNVMPVHLAAIVSEHRRRGYTFDTKAPQIQAVMRPVRREIRKNAKDRTIPG